MPQYRLHTALLLALFLGPRVFSALVQDGHPQLSPFTAVRMRAEVPEVRYGETWYELASIDGIAAARILEHSKQAFGSLWEKRFAEDLVQVLAGMDHAVGGEVSLVLIELDGKKRIEVARAPMTEANRRLVRNARAESGPAGRKDDDEWPKRSPFTALRTSGNRIEVRYEDRWFEWIALDDLAVTEILGHCKQAYGPLWEKRLAEDLVQVLAGMGHRVGDEVALTLRAPEDAKPIEVPRAAMTEANRRSVWTERSLRSTSGAAPARALRAHATEADPAYRFLSEPGRQRWPADEPRLARASAEQDLDELELLIERHYSYRDLRGVDWHAALDAIRCSLPDEIGRGEFALRLAKLLALAGDGHSALDEDVGALVPGGFAPFLLGDLGAQVVAFTPERERFLDPDRPCLTAIDGIPLQRWIATAAALVARGSPAVARLGALRLLRCVDLLRGELGLEVRPTVELELAALDGTRAERRTLALVASKPIYGTWPPGEHRLLDGSIGYLRLATMSDSPSFLEGLDAAMQGFRDTQGLVIDVRGNGGGRRDALLRLFPYFMSPAEPPYVANVAACRLEPGQPADRPEGYLEDRYLWPLSSPRFGAEERAVIEAAAARFEPSWTPPPGEFSAWHWLVLSRATNPRAYAYEKPLVILLDGGCFSATDIFLAAFAGRRNVTLLGQPSSGGSGRARAFRLGNSGVGVRISSMASFRPDGRGYDGLGIEPSVHVTPAPGDFLGRGDAQLEAALARLR